MQVFSGNIGKTQSGSLNCINVCMYMYMYVSHFPLTCLARALQVCYNSA